MPSSGLQVTTKVWRFSIGLGLKDVVGFEALDLNAFRLEDNTNPLRSKPPGIGQPHASVMGIREVVG